MPRSFRRAVSCIAAVIVAAACASPPAPAQSRRVFTPPAAAEVQPHVQIRMRDGARLDANVYLPGKQPGRWPVVLIRTPYKDELNANPAFHERLLAEGYAIVQQHERGRYLSEGRPAMLTRAAEDGWDTLDWIAAQPWSNGRIATYGCSSSAENQLKLATLDHPAHKAMIAYSAGVGVAEAGPFREQGNFWRGGVWQQGWLDYFLTAMQSDWPQLPPGLTDDQRQRAARAFTVDNTGRKAADLDLDAARMHLPMIDIARSVDAADNEIEAYLSRGPVHPAWDEDRVIDSDVIKVPGLWAEALYDISARSTVAFFEKTRAESPAGEQAIIIANGSHCGFGGEKADHKIGDRPIGDPRLDYDARHIAWLDRWLKDKTDAPPPAAPIQVYMAGVNRWVSFASVPKAGVDPSHTFFLSSAGKANTLDGDGQLAAAAPTTPAIDRFAYDPANPVIAHGGEISGVGKDQEDGAFDQREIEKRPDVLVYTSAPLEEDLAVFGYISTELFVASDAPDTDFTVKLVDVAPNGTAWNIADTIQRMRYRDGEETAVFMRPGDAYRIAPPPMLAANVFRKGHRVRIEVSSSNFPSYARNLNTTGDPYTTTEFRIANNSVLHGPATLSKITLPVVNLPKP
jgi:putative CocE/NonD family hydrolase